MKFQFTTLRWVFLVLYVLFLITVISISFLSEGVDAIIPVILLAILVLGTQFLLVGSTSAINFCNTNKGNSAVFPAIIGGLALAVLSGGFLVGLSELIRFHTSDGLYYIFAILIVSWLLWTIIFIFRYREADPDSIPGKILKIALLGSVLEMVLLAPMHIITSARGHCFAGLLTALGLLAGLCIALWSFGPGIFLLFLRHYKKQKAKHNH